MNRRLPAEWEPQSLMQFTFPHPESDWEEDWKAASACFVEIIETVLQFQPVLLVAHSTVSVNPFFSDNYRFPLHIVEQPSNDCWARDHGPISILENEKAILLDFGFNGWGLKYPANLDNQLTGRLHSLGLFVNTPLRIPGLILEGGSIDTDGNGTILTTSRCLLSPNRNPHLSKSQIEERLKDYLGAKRIHWLNHGYLIGDDTDGHIDTLARFCAPDAITYVHCDDPSDEQYRLLFKLEEELQHLKTEEGHYYKLVPLPLPDPIFAADGHRLPATYANFLVLNNAVLVPQYGQSKDKIALSVLRKLFPKRQVFGIDCQVLIRQHGSLHCLGMQYPIQVKNIWNHE